MEYDLKNKIKMAQSLDQLRHQYFADKKKKQNLIKAIKLSAIIILIGGIIIWL